MTTIPEQIGERLRADGFLVRGGFYPDAAHGAPDGVATILIIGNAGPDMWRAFSKARRDEPSPLDNWTKRVIDPVAEAFGARAVYPSDGPPFVPFQRWAVATGDVFPSPIKPLIHPEYGLWHAYRGALLFAEKLPLPAVAVAENPCETCADRPCLTACPVGALAPQETDIPACAAHVRSDAGTDCRTLSCRARRACPVGVEYVYEPDQAAHHMAAFLGSRGI